MFRSIILLFLISTILFIIGYSFVFKTQQTITTYKTLSNIKEGTFLDGVLSGNRHLVWMKITGVAILLFAFITSLLIVLLF